MAVGVQVPPSAPSNEKAPFMGLFYAYKKGSSVLVFSESPQGAGGKLT